MDERWFFRVNQTMERTVDNYMVHVVTSAYTLEGSLNCTSTIVTETCVAEIGQVNHDVKVESTQVHVQPRASSDWTSNNISRTLPHDEPTMETPGSLWALGYIYTYFGSYSGW